MPVKIQDRKKSRRKKSRMSTASTSVSRIANIEGIFSVKMPPEMQKKLGLEIGETLVPDMPWTPVLKKDLLDDLEEQGDESIFAAAKDQITAYPKDELYVGYDPDMEELSDTFFLAVNVKAEEVVLGIIKHLEEEQKQRVIDSIWRSIGDWQSLGSEEEITGTRILTSRAMIQEEATIDFVPTVHPEFDDVAPKDLKHGYVQLTNSGMNSTTFSNVVRHCIDMGAQVSPVITSQEAQTELTYPINMGTQYVYSVDTDTPLEDGPLAKSLAEFLSSHLDIIENTLIYNKGLRILKNDFDDIVLDIRDTRIPSTVIYKELESFIHVDSSKGMIITAIDWHPTMTGMAACAYGEDVRILPKKTRKGKEDREEEDVVLRDIYIPNVVLVWCFTDCFKPKLYLTSPRPVHSLKFCPYDENILIGGLVNGQIVLWDLKDRVQIVETKEKLTPNQEIHRVAMNNHLQWMKIVRNPAKVPPTAVSSIEFSHQKCITSIQWLTPFWVMTSTGHYSHSLEELDTEDMPMQFLTSSEDGSINIWDLKVKQQAKAGSYQPKKKWKVRKRLPGLEKSDYQPLNRFIRPHFRIVLEEPKIKGAEQMSADDDGDMSPIYVPLSTMSFEKFPVETILQEDEKSESESVSETSDKEEGEDGKTEGGLGAQIEDSGDSKKSTEEKQERKKYLVSPQLVENAPECVVNVGSVDGRIIKFKWQGLVGNLNEVVNYERGEVLGIGLAIHDGPIVVVQPSPFVNDLILTIGGKVFAVWRDDVRDVPMFWKHSPVNIYSGAWSAFRPTMIILVRGDGVLEAWDLSIYSHKALFQQTLPGKKMTCLSYPSLPFIPDILGMGDNNGAFRVHEVPPQHRKSPEIGCKEEIIMLENAFIREKVRKNTLQECTERYKMNEEKQMQQATIVAEEPGEQKPTETIKESIRSTLNLNVDDKCEEFDDEYDQLMQPVNPPIEIAQILENRWRADRSTHMKKIILERLQWDKNAIIEAEEPFRIKQEQEEAKQQKILKRMHQKYHIFEEILKVLFPEMEEKIVHDDETNQNYLEELEAIKPHFVLEHDAAERHAKKYIVSHPYSRGFDWILLVQECIKRRKELDIELNIAFKELSDNSIQVKTHPLLSAPQEEKDNEEQRMSFLDDKPWEATEAEMAQEGSEEQEEVEVGEETEQQNTTND